MLAGYLNLKAKEEAWQSYTAQMLWYTASAQFKAIGAELKQPSWAEMLKPKQTDERTGREIRDDLVKKLQERQEKRGRRDS